MSGPHEYAVTSTEPVYHGAILDVRVDTVTMPGGGTAKREIVGHPGAVAVVAVDTRGPEPALVLVRQYRHAVAERLWELPAGLLDVDGEPPRDAAARELREEAGLAAAEWEELVTIVPSPGFSEERVTIFAATGLTDVGRPAAEHEEADMEVAVVALDEARAWVLDGRITNGIAVAGILAYCAR